MLALQTRTIYKMKEKHMQDLNIQPRDFITLACGYLDQDCGTIPATSSNNLHNEGIYTWSPGPTTK
jgi:hypothetical protein